MSEVNTEGGPVVPRSVASALRAEKHGKLMDEQPSLAYTLLEMVNGLVSVGETRATFRAGP